MKALLTINGNVVEIECTPEEFAIVLGSPLPEGKRRQPKRPEQNVSYAKLYHEALGMSFMEYIASDPNKPTEEFVKDILDKCVKLSPDVPSVERLRDTVEEAKRKLQSPRV